MYFKVGNNTQLKIKIKKKTSVKVDVKILWMKNPFNYFFLKTIYKKTCLVVSFDIYCIQYKFRVISSVLIKKTASFTPLIPFQSIEDFEDFPSI